MMTAGNLLFEVRFEIGMLAGLGYWKKGILGTKAEGRRGGGLKSPPHEMSCRVRYAFPGLPWSNYIHILIIEVLV